jgi:hypothetical protein
MFMLVPEGMTSQLHALDAMFSYMRYIIYIMGAIYTTVFPKTQNRYYCINICLLAVDTTCFDPHVGPSSGIYEY